MLICRAISILTNGERIISDTLAQDRKGKSSTPYVDAFVFCTTVDICIQRMLTCKAKMHISQWGQIISDPLALVRKGKITPNLLY